MHYITTIGTCFSQQVRKKKQVGGSRSLARDSRPMATVSTNTFYSAVAADTAPDQQGATWTK